MVCSYAERLKQGTTQAAPAPPRQAVRTAPKAQPQPQSQQQKGGSTATQTAAGQSNGNSVGPGAGSGECLLLNRCEVDNGAGSDDESMSWSYPDAPTC